MDEQDSDLVTASGTAALDARKAYFVAEISAIFRVHKTTVYRDIKEGRLPALRMGKGRGTLRVLGAVLLSTYQGRAATVLEETAEAAAC